MNIRPSTITVEPHSDAGYSPGSELNRLRAAKFRALASLFRLDLPAYAPSIETLLELCPGVHTCPVRGGVVESAGQAALQWVAAGADSVSIGSEHVRLFGGPDLAHEMPVVSPCAAMYMSEDYDGDPGDVLVVYNAMGFVPRLGTGLCPVHISNELDFMAYCLDQMQGPYARDAHSVARAFIASHLFGWGVVFSAATYSRSEHPVTRFAGLMLEHILFCELEHLRGSAVGPGISHHSMV